MTWVSCSGLSRAHLSSSADASARGCTRRMRRPLGQTRPNRSVVSPSSAHLAALALSSSARVFGLGCGGPVLARTAACQHAACMDEQVLVWTYLFCFRGGFEAVYGDGAAGADTPPLEGPKRIESEVTVARPIESSRPAAAAVPPPQSPPQPSQQHRV